MLLIGREEAGEEVDDRGGVAAHDLVEALDGGGVGGFGVESAETIAVGFVGDVFVQGAVGLLLSEEEAGVAGAEGDGSLREVEDIAGFELSAEGAGLFGGGGEGGVRDGDDGHSEYRVQVAGYR